MSLQELQHATPLDCVDAGDLRLAMEKLSIVIGQINETRRQVECSRVVSGSNSHTVTSSSQNENFLHQVELENGMRGLPADLKLAADGRKFVREYYICTHMFWTAS